MQQGVHAETHDDKLQNKLRGVGSLMRNEGFAIDDRLHLARGIYKLLAPFKGVNRATVFAAFFEKGEISDMATEQELTDSQDF